MPFNRRPILSPQTQGNGDGNANRKTRKRDNEMGNEKLLMMIQDGGNEEEMIQTKPRGSGAMPKFR